MHGLRETPQAFSLPQAHLACRLFQRAAQYVSIDWNAHKLLDPYLEYESSQQDLQRMADVYMMALALPMKELSRFYKSFTAWAAQHPLSAMASPEQIAAATHDVCSYWLALMGLLAITDDDAQSQSPLRST